jgi:hypothetical protein
MILMIMIKFPSSFSAAATASNNPAVSRINSHFRCRERCYCSVGCRSSTTATPLIQVNIDLLGERRGEGEPPIYRV